MNLPPNVRSCTKKLLDLDSGAAAEFLAAIEKAHRLNLEAAELRRHAWALYRRVLRKEATSK
jgi:hypothetical protein